MPSIAGFDKQAEADIASPDTFLSNFEPLTVEQAKALVDHVVEFDQYTEPMKRLLEDFVTRSGDGLCGLFRAPAHGGRQPFEEPALSAEAAGPGQRAGDRTWRSRRASRSRRRGRAARAFSGERGAGRPAQQSAGPEDRLAAAGRLQPDPLPGTARAVHGFRLQPDRQIALDDGIRQRRRANERSVQCPMAGGRSEQCAGFGDPDELRRIHHRRWLCRAAVPRGS